MIPTQQGPDIFRPPVPLENRQIIAVNQHRTRFSKIRTGFKPDIEAQKNILGRFKVSLADFVRRCAAGHNDLGPGLRRRLGPNPGNVVERTIFRGMVFFRRVVYKTGNDKVRGRRVTEKIPTIPHQVHTCNLKVRSQRNTQVRERPHRDHIVGCVYTEGPFRANGCDPPQDQRRVVLYQGVKTFPDASLKWNRTRPVYIKQAPVLRIYLSAHEQIPSAL